jgi:xanthine dehydrogenase accessory factor
MGNSVPDRQTLETALRWVSWGHCVALGTVVTTLGSAPRQPGCHIAIRDDGVFAGSVSAGCAENAVIMDALAVMQAGETRTLRFGRGDAVAPGLACGGAIEILVRPASATLLAELLAQTPPPPELIIVGAVHIAQSLATMAQAAGHDVRIIDPRTGYATRERFAGVRLDHRWPDDALAAEPLTARSALVILAHDPKIDDAALMAGLRSPAGYIGVLGSRYSHAARLVRLAAEGFTARDLSRLHGPVGLDIGARTPEEIAIAILAELVRVARKPASVISVMVMAAGHSRRMGRNKLILPWRGKPLVRHAVESAIESGIGPVVVVTGHDGTVIQQALSGLDVTFAHNDDHAKGLSASLRCGVEAMPQGCAAAMVLLGDMPKINASTIRRVASLFDPVSGSLICAASAEGRLGHPILWDQSFFPALASLRGDVGAREMLRQHTDKLVMAGFDSAEIFADIDTPADLAPV